MQSSILNPQPPPGTPVPQALYSCAVCADESSWPAGDLHWHPASSRWLCRNCLDDLPEQGISLQDWLLRLKSSGRFRPGDRVRKKSGSSWRGRVVGAYSTGLTPEGYCVESFHEPGSVQIYPVSALETLPESD